MALAAANELPQRTCSAALDRQICRSLLVMPPKEISLRPTPSFASIKRRKLLKVYYQQQTKRPTPQEVPNNNRPAPDVPNAPIVSEVQEDDPQQASPHPTEIDVMIEVDVQIDEERKVNPPRAKKRVLGSHVDETACPDTAKERGEYDRSKRLATTEAEADQEQMKLDVKKKDVKQQWASFLNWNNPRNKAKNYEDESSSFDSSSPSQVNDFYERARKLQEEWDAEEEAKNEKANNEEDDISTTFWTAGSPSYWTAYPDHYEKENWSPDSYQQDNSTISSVQISEDSATDDEEIHPGIKKTGRYQFEVYIDADDWIGEAVPDEDDWNNWTMNSDYINDELESIYSGKCWEVQQYVGYQIAANKQYRLTQELFDRLRKRGIQMKIKESCRSRSKKK